MPRFNAAAIGKLAKQARATDRRKESPAVPDRRAAKAVTVRPGMLAISTTSITARTGTSPTFTLGTGTATGLWLEGGVTSSSGVAYTVLNALPDSIATGKLVTLLEVDGAWIVVLADCS